MNLIQPDIELIEEIEEKSKSPLKTCMQCGECSVVCSLSPDDKPFPRKEMIWAGWGLKEKIYGNPDIWLCHQCGDCTEHCPRGVKPADVLASLRQLTYLHYAKPKFLGKLLAKPALLPVALIIPLFIILAIIYAAGTLHIPEGPVNYSKFFPHAWLNSSFTVLTFITIAFTIAGLVKFWKDMKKYVPGQQKQKPVFKSLMETIREISFHSNFSKCTGQRTRKIAHLLIMYGFVLLLLVTAYAIAAVITHGYPLGFWNPFKMLGNVAALMLTVGISMMMVQRIRNKEIYGASNYFDWVFLTVLLILTLSGVVVELARFLKWHSAYHIYMFHLVMVWFIIIYLPYTKFGHIIYRTLAMVFCKVYGR